MPCPFPGMDPYLEHAEIFPDFHDSFVAYLRERLQTQLPEPYYAAIGRRAWIEVSERFIGPDVNLLTPRQRGDTQERSPVSVAVATRPSTRPIVIHIPHDERVEPLVEVFMGRGSERQLVTSIEMLSLTNKTPGERGRDLYLRKQQEILRSKVHLVEIDLLRGGQHTTAVPYHRLVRETGPLDYHVSIHHFDNLEDYFVYPIQLTEALPEIPIPLSPGDGAVSLNLQAVFERTYAAGPYAREIDYARDTVVPALSPEQQTWAAQRIAQHSGRRQT